MTGSQQAGLSPNYDPTLLYGTGDDGALGTNGVPFTLIMTRSMQFTEVWVTPGSTIITNNYALFVSIRLRVDGTIQNNGGNGQDAIGVTFNPTGRTNGGAGGGATNGTLAVTSLQQGATGREPFKQPDPATSSTLAMFTSVPNVNGLYPSGLLQMDLYQGGNANTTFPQGSMIGGGTAGSVTGLPPLANINLLNAMSFPIRYDGNIWLTPFTLTGGMGGAAGYSANPEYVAAAGGGGGGVIFIAAAEFYSDSAIPTGILSAQGGNAGRNASTTDVSGGGGGGGLIIVKTTTPYAQWGIADVRVNGGSPQNQNFGPGSPSNQPVAFGQPGYVLFSFIHPLVHDD